MKILIVEDEPKARDQLRNMVRGMSPGAVVVAVDNYDEAERELATTPFDLIFSDILLLPQGTRYVSGELHDSEGTTRRMGPHDWHEFTIARGGVGLIHGIRTQKGPNLYTPVVVVTWFVEPAGYERVTRRLMLDGDPRLILLPKFSRVEALRPKLVETVQPMLLDLQQRLGDVIRQSLQVPWANDGEDLRRAAREVRDAYAVTKTRGDRAAIGSAIHGNERGFEHYAAVVGYLSITVDPSNDLKSFVKLLSSDDPGHDELAHLYDDWPTFRDWVLLNPMIDVALALDGRMNMPSDVFPPLETPLPTLATNHDEATARFHNAGRQLRSRLTERLLLTYLAGHTEPPQAEEEGWAVSRKGLMAAAADLDANPDAPWRTRERWGQAPGTDPNVAGLLERIAKGDGIHDRLQAVSASIIKETAESVLQGDGSVLGELSGERGWYFNGCLRVVLPKEEWHIPEAAEAQRVAFFPLRDDIPFACLSGRRASAHEVELRFQDAGMRVERFAALSDVATLSARMPDATLAVVAPVDDELLDSFIHGAAREQWRAADIKTLPPTILVLSDDVGIRSADEMDRLREIGVDCMYPSRIEDALDLTKIMDHVICAGYRTRYESFQTMQDSPPDRKAARATFTELFEMALDSEYDGDMLSGACSARMGTGMAITASKTDKRSPSPNDVALVHHVDVVRNRIEWSGVNKPSSSSRWHALIYELFPDTRVILHTHWKSLTYSPALERYRTAQYRLSGSRREAADIGAVLLSNHPIPGFAVIRDHGEVFAASTVDALRETIEQVRAHVAAFV